MLNKYFLPTALLFLLLTSCTDRRLPDRPNIIIILTDDQGYGDTGAFGAVDFTTPHLDQLASEGMRFTNFYSPQAVCSASRAGLLTGCYPNRIGINGALMPWARVGISDEEMTLAQLLKQKDYATAIVGKWHLGHHRQFLPLQHGFDEYLGIPYSNDMWPVNFDGTPITDTSSWKYRYPPLPLIDGNEKVEEIRTLEDQSTLTTRYTERALRFIEENKEHPFFLYLAHSMPHVPLGVSEKFKGKSKQGMYGDVIMEIDWSVGEIMKALDTYHLTGQTLLVFISDNGPWLNFGNHAGSTGGLREGKGTSFEGGQSIPAIIRWPGTIPSHRISNTLMSTIDLFPTLAAITGAPLPQHKIDGVNMLPVLEGKNVSPRNHFFYYYGANQLEAVRKGHWKLIFPHKHRSYIGHAPGKDGWPGATHTDSIGLELYNLRRDPGERYNVIDQYPDVVEELQALGKAAREDMGDALTGRKGTNNRDCGHVE